MRPFMTRTPARLAFLVAAAFPALALVASGAPPTQKKPQSPSAPAISATVTAADVQAYAAKFLPFDPDSRVTAERAKDRLPGMQGWTVHRKGRYEKLNVDRVFFVSDDGRWFFAGDSTSAPASRNVRSAGDLSWVEEAVPRYAVAS